jgi:hypothetical protein
MDEVAGRFATAHPTSPSVAGWISEGDGIPGGLALGNAQHLAGIL